MPPQIVSIINEFIIIINEILKLVINEMQLHKKIIINNDYVYFLI